MPENKNARNRKLEALDYQEQGWAVLPLHTIVSGICTCHKKEKCPGPGKHPRTRNGVKDATKDIKHEIEEGSKPGEKASKS